MKSILLTFTRWILWQRVPAREIEFKALNQETVLLLRYSIFYIIAGYVLGLVIAYFPAPMLGATQFNQDLWYSGVFKILLLLIIPGYIYFIRWNYQIKNLTLGLRPTLMTFLATAFMVVLGFFLNASHLKPLENTVDTFPDASLRLAMGIIMPLFTAALPEELFFRGYLQTRLEKKWNRVSAALVATLLFTAWHLPSRYLLSRGIEGQAGDMGQVILQTGIPVFIIGFIFAMHWSRYRNIILLILTHWAVDILPALSSYFKIPF